MSFVDLAVGENNEKRQLLEHIESLNQQLTLLLMEKADTIKRANYLAHKYLSLVGEHEMNRYQAYIQYETVRRMIEIYQRAINRQETISEEEVNKIIEVELQEYEAKINEYAIRCEVARMYLNGDRVTLDELKQIKMIYRFIVKQIHPDLHPDLSDELNVLWNMTQEAYTSNNLEELQTIFKIIEGKQIVTKSLENELEKLQKTILSYQANIDKVLLEINNMKNQYPFDFLHIIEDQKALEDHLEEINCDTDEYIARTKELNLLLETLKFTSDGAC